MTTYRYLGDRLTDSTLKGARVHAVRRANGKCVRGRGSMLVITDDGRRIVVIARLLRKVQ